MEEEDDADEADNDDLLGELLLEVRNGPQDEITSVVRSDNLYPFGQAEAPTWLKIRSPIPL